MDQEKWHKFTCVFWESMLWFTWRKKEGWETVLEKKNPLTQFILYCLDIVQQVFFNLQTL